MYHSVPCHVFPTVSIPLVYFLDVQREAYTCHTEWVLVVVLVHVLRYFCFQLYGSLEKDINMTV